MTNVVNSELSQSRERADSVKRNQPDAEPVAWQTLTGWKAKFLGYMFDVRKANDSDITDLLGEITAAVEATRTGTLKKIDNEEDVDKKGEIARAQVSDTTAATRGTVDFTSELFQLIDANLVGTPSPKMFVLEEPQQQFLAWRDKADFTGTTLNRSLTFNDIVNGPVHRCFMVEESVGKEFTQLFKRHDHKVAPLKYGDGFKAEIGGLSLMFMYHEGAAPAEDAETAADDDEPTSDTAGNLDKPTLH